MWKTVKKNQGEIIKLKSTISEIKNALDSINSRLMQQKKRRVNFRNHLNWSTQRKKKKKKAWLNDLWDCIKQSNKCANLSKSKKKYLPKIFPNWIKTTNYRSRTFRYCTYPSQINTMKTTLKLIKVKLLKTKDKEKY